jgi:hypothetical protein
MNTFPFWSKSLSSPEDMFHNLITQKINIISDKYGNKIVERNYPEDYFKCDHLSNHFTEYERIICQFGFYATPLDTWKSIKKDKNINQLSLLEQRELVYSSTRECNTFNVTFCLSIINTLVGPNAKILDPSSGWGDRLIASIASKAEIYHGFDPNKNLQKGYKNIVKTFKKYIIDNNKNKTNNFTITSIPFEEAILSDNYYDIALTSPPYFDLEKYGTDANQSINKYPTYEDWLTFYKQYILKMIQAVKSNGYIVIYIEDVTSNGTRYNMREFTIKTVNDSKKMKQHMRFGLKVGKSIRYALVWQKR